MVFVRSGFCDQKLGSETDLEARWTHFRFPALMSFISCANKSNLIQVGHSRMCAVGDLIANVGLPDLA